MMLTLDPSNALGGVVPPEYTMYGEVTYGADVYQITGLYQSPFMPPRNITYALSGKVYFGTREATGGVWSTWAYSTTSGSFTAAGEWQYKVIFTGNYDSGDYAEVI